MFVEVWVSAATGEVRVSRMLGSFDCGRILNPRTAVSQLRCGMIMGRGQALMAAVHDERKGRIVSASLPTTTCPSISTCPRSK